MALWSVVTPTPPSPAHPNLESIDCHQDHDTCFFTSRMKIRDAAAVKRDLEARWGFLWDINKLVSNLHYKTYHTIEGEEGPPAGQEHYVDWDFHDFHCETVLYSSTGMSLANHHMEKGHISPGVTGYAYLDATLVQDPEKPLQTVQVAATFSCWLFSNICCTDSMWTQLFIDGEEAIPPLPELQSVMVENKLTVNVDRVRLGALDTCLQCCGDYRLEASGDFGLCGKAQGRPIYNYGYLIVNGRDYSQRL
ncbi:hypothetical protein NM208_g16048 [Fusarium decemcellulare]|uniref:Uncharacterized protein n=1 Tax=Fusarium decemcellulare TaxID=57161 RepID=A0ACC1REN6_9HYPO|nr:hypothetical protein NM208_g16048 [Fusarium decemcellulare]